MLDHKSLPLQIAIAMILAVGIGYVLDENTAILGAPVLPVFELIGTLFLNALKMIVLPLIVASLIIGVAGSDAHPQDQSLGRLGLHAFLYYLLTSALAICVGLLCVNLIAPGLSDGKPIQSLMQVIGLDARQGVAQSIGEHHWSELSQLFTQLIPANVVNAASEGKLLGVVMFSLFYGVFLRYIRMDLKHVQIQFWQGVYEVMLKLTAFIIAFAPIGVFALVAMVLMKLDAGQSVAYWRALFWFGLTVAIALAIHMLVSLSFILMLHNVPVFKHIQAMRLPLLTAFSTASSAATLPLTLTASEDNGVSKRTSSFVLPLGATVNMDGTALYECVAVMFVAQVLGVELSIVMQLTVVLVALLTSIGVAGVPAASLVAIAIIFDVVGLPIEAMALILPIDRLLDMFRTMVNVYSDTVAAKVLDKH